MRRKKKVAQKNNSAESDRKILQVQKKLGTTAITGIEEVNLFKSDSNVIHFNNPKVNANISSNTYFISGRADERTIQELLPGIMQQLGQENIEQVSE